MGASSTIKLEGASQYKAELKQIAQESKTLAAEMKAVTSAFTSATSASDRQKASAETLNKQIATQERYIQTLTSAIEAESAASGENSVATLKLREQLNNAKTALNGMNNELNNSSSSFSNADASANTFSSTLKALLAKDLIVGGMKAIGSAVGALASGLVSIGKEAVQSYADFEQLEGGVKKIFGDAASEVVQNANKAFQTVGVSANEYMQTVTSFSASLKQSLGGDVVAAAQLADTALQDMADNANTYGSEFSSIESAYQGFAKQNYTMLDNLKLGYGGTKTEMERLIKDANDYNKTIGKNTNYQISSYADVVSAIHDIQVQQGIAGTTAMEASKTITGSINATKAAWQNMLTELGKSDGDIEGAANNLINSFANVATNLTPIVSNIIAALPMLVEALIPGLQAIIPDLITAVCSVLPSLITGIVAALPAILTALWDGLKAAAVELAPVAMSYAEQFKTTLQEKFAEMKSSVQEWIKTYIVEPIKNKVNDFVEAGKNLVEGLWNGINDKLAWMKSRISEWVGNVTEYFRSLLKIGSPSKLFAEYGGYIVEGLAIGIKDGTGYVTKALDGVNNAMAGEMTGINSNGFVTGGKVVNMTINATTIDESLLDYVTTVVNRRLGEAI